MNILIAPDSFKGSLTSTEAVEAIRSGLLEVWPKAGYRLFPMADGGEGTAEVLVKLVGGNFIEAETADPLGRPRRAAWALLADGRTAVVESAAASGLILLDSGELDPARATSQGAGQLLARALDQGAEQIIIGLGGSAFNDGGAGFLSALGFRFLDAQGRILPPGGLALADLADIDQSGRHPRLAQVRILVASDVKNPLCGEYGASRVFGPQKGADPEMVRKLDAALGHFAKVAARVTGRDVTGTPGAGAAGGLGAGLMLFTGATFEPGAKVVMDMGGFEEKLNGVDLVITGEGRTDAQTVWGKVPQVVAASAAARGIRTVVLSGALSPGYEALFDCGASYIRSIVPGPLSLSEAMNQAGPLLTRAARDLARLLAVLNFR